MTSPPNVSSSDLTTSHHRRRSFYCVFLSCITPGAHGLCFQSEPSRIRHSNRTPPPLPNGPALNPLARTSNSGTTSQQPNFYIFSPLHAAPYQVTESPLITTTTTTTKTKKKKNYTTNRRKLDATKTPTKKTFEIARYHQVSEMMEHDILTRQEEMELGGKVVRALELRDAISTLVEEEGSVVLEDSISGQNWENMDLISTYGSTAHSDDDLFDPFGDDYNDEDGGHDSDWMGFSDEMRITDELYANNAPNPLPRGDFRISNALVENGSKLRYSAVIADLNALPNYDFNTEMNIAGGRREVLEILYDGVKAREVLMTCNIRLVVSIAKKWMKGSAYANSGEGVYMSSLYEGGWGRPSLDEAIQEGVLGLARAVDKFDPERGLRFSTYSTHWITNYVRQCFQAAATGCLKVPGKLQDIKSSYRRIQMRHLHSADPTPTEEEIAKEIGVSVSRLRTALRVTETLKSIDEPLAGMTTGHKGSGAGGDKTENSLTMSDRLECQEIAPEEYVEISFLRQTLENAMAAELSPHERDVLRLRLGLDDGQTRTVKEVVEEYGGGISLADVRSAEQRAVKKLSSPHALYTHNLFDYIGMTGM